MGHKSVLLVDSGAAYAALAESAAGNEVLLKLAITLSAVAARYDIAIWVERVPTIANPADLLPGRQKLSFKTESQKGLATDDERLCLRDLPRTLQRTEKIG